MSSLDNMEATYGALYLSRVGLASSERIRERRNALWTRYSILANIFIGNCTRKHPQLAVGDVIEGGGVDLEVLGEDFLGNVRHPVGHGEGRVLTELPIVEHLYVTD